MSNVHVSLSLFHSFIHSFSNASINRRRQAKHNIVPNVSRSLIPHWQSIWETNTTKPFTQIGRNYIAIRLLLCIRLTNTNINVTISMDNVLFAANSLVMYFLSFPIDPLFTLNNFLHFLLLLNDWKNISTKHTHTHTHDSEKVKIGTILLFFGSVSEKPKWANQFDVKMKSKLLPRFKLGNHI